jgi:2-keto-myo-inositol isomerase
MQFALNHVTLPNRRFGEFAQFARALGIADVEIRNDLPGVEIADGAPPDAIRRQAETAGVRIAAINALQRFDDWNDVRAAEATALARYARVCGAGAVVLCPVNAKDDRRGPGERAAALRRALAALTPILAAEGVRGLVEPLGFLQSALRTKRAALVAIDEVNGAGVFALVHDTFHHFLAGETEIFPARTGLVHVSGAGDGRLERGEIEDRHRTLVFADDILGTLAQVQALLRGGYRGLVSMEAFAPSVQESADIAAALTASLALLRTASGA